MKIKHNLCWRMRWEQNWCHHLHNFKRYAAEFCSLLPQGFKNIFLYCHTGMQSPQTKGKSPPQKLEVGSRSVPDLLHTVRKKILDIHINPLLSRAQAMLIHKLVGYKSTFWLKLHNTLILTVLKFPKLHFIGTDRPFVWKLT